MDEIDNEAVVNALEAIV